MRRRSSASRKAVFANIWQGMRVGLGKKTTFKLARTEVWDAGVPRKKSGSAESGPPPPHPPPFQTLR